MTRDQESFNNKREADKFEMEMNGDENHDNRRCICNYPCSRCSSCRFSFSGNDSNLFFALKRFINVTCNRKKRKRRRTETNCEKKLSDFNCGLISETFKTFYMSFCQKMKVVRQQTQNYSMLKHQTSSKVTYIIFFALLLSLQIRLSASQEEKPLKFEDIVNKTTYDKMRPPKPEGGATEVFFHVTVMSLDTIDEGSMTYAADVFFSQEWKDHRLILPDNMTREYRLLPVEWLHMIWRPDSFFKNAKKVTFQTMTIPNHYVWLYKDKTILYMVKLTLLLSCAMHFENYPHDEQTCRLSMESLSHTTDDLIFQWLPVDKTPLAVDDGIQLPQLELINNKTGDCTSVYSTGNFTCLEVIFKFRRRLGYYLFHTYIPTCLIVMMSWISFWIKPEAVPARVTLGVTSLLTLSTQHANSQKSLPPVSYIKAIDLFMSSCMIFVFLSLIEYAFVNVMMGDISDVERKDKTGHLRNIIVTANSNMPRAGSGYPDRHTHLPRHPSQQTYVSNLRGGTGASFQGQLPIQHQSHQMGHGQHMLGQQSLFSSQDQLQEIQDVSEFNPVIMQQTEPQQEAQSDPRLYYEQCPKHGGPNRSPESHEDIVGSIATRPEDMVVKESSALLNSGGGGNAEILPSDNSMIPLGTISSSAGLLANNAGGADNGQQIGTNTLATQSDGAKVADSNKTGGPNKSKANKKNDPKEIMKKRRERAICIDRVSRVIFPSTFILLNIIYWLVFSEILEAIQYTTGIDMGAAGDDDD